MAVVAQLVEHLIVVQDVAGSSPVDRPSSLIVIANTVSFSTHKTHLAPHPFFFSLRFLYALQ